jgi:putative transcriptional regulator
MTAIVHHPAHHPESDMLLAYAAGATDAPTSLILATHLTFCPACRAAVALGEQMGGMLLAGLAPAPLAEGALARTLARLEAPETAPSVRQPASTDKTPAPLRAWLGRDLNAVRWRRMGPRLAYVPLYHRGSVRMRLLRGAPGADTGCHDHRGQEYTLVLAGGYTDRTGNYGPGDFQTAAPDLKHNPVADPGEDCINRAVTTAPLRFDGLIQKVAAKLFGF